MMDPSLPDDLQDIEHRLRQRPVDAADDLRARVLLAIEHEFSSQIRASRRRYAIAAAAVLMIGANLSMISASVTSVSWVPPPRHVDITTTRQSVQRLIPELSPDEARRMSITLLAANQSPRIPLIPAISPSNTMRGPR